MCLLFSFMWQLASKVLTITGKKWINGTVPVDSTVGNYNFFIVTWILQKSEILLQDPKGKKYKNSFFKENILIIWFACLRIPSIAEVRIFFYFLHALSINFEKKMQIISYTLSTFKQLQIICHNEEHQIE